MLTPRDLLPQKSAIEQGTVWVNEQTSSSTAVLRNGDIISHRLHRHEPPVTAEAITVVHEDDRLLVINKPAGLPVHPAGRYYHNSVTQLLQTERGPQFQPRPCHRLDRLTSGLMLFGKDAAIATKLSRQLVERSVWKEYVARVVGEFPPDEVVCEQPILGISPKLGLNRVRADGKAAKTVFKRLAYVPGKAVELNSTGEGEGGDNEARHAESGHETLPNSIQNAEHNTQLNSLGWRKPDGYSIVRCRPLTGRTHQIRVHLQFLGHPIANDPIYCNQRVFGPSLGCGDAGEGAADEDVIARLSRMGKDEVADAMAYHDDVVTRHAAAKAEKMTGERCAECDTPLYSDPGPHELGIYLHARRYGSNDGSWAYETAMPAWATEHGVDMSGLSNDKT